MVSSRYWNVIRPKGALPPFTPPMRTLHLSDYVRRLGVEYAILAMFVAESVGADIYDGPNSEGAYLAGDVLFDPNATLSRVQVHNNGNAITVNRTGTTSLSDLFKGIGAFSNDPFLDIQTLDGLSNHAFDDSGDGFARFTHGDNDSIGDDIDTDDRFIVAVYYSPLVLRGFGLGFGLGYG